MGLFLKTASDSALTRPRLSNVENYECYAPPKLPTLQLWTWVIRDCILKSKGYSRDNSISLSCSPHPRRVQDLPKIFHFSFSEDRTSFPFVIINFSAHVTVCRSTEGSLSCLAKASVEAGAGISEQPCKTHNLPSSSQQAPDRQSSR